MQNERLRNIHQNTIQGRTFIFFEGHKDMDPSLRAGVIDMLESPVSPRKYNKIRPPRFRLQGFQVWLRLSAVSV